jgi:hypothetical protein
VKSSIFSGQRKGLTGRQRHTAEQIIGLASYYGLYGYRLTTAVLRNDGETRIFPQEANA